MIGEAAAYWIPAFAGMTAGWGRKFGKLIPPTKAQSSIRLRLVRLAAGLHQLQALLDLAEQRRERLALGGG